jgi:hypothetical protein
LSRIWKKESYLLKQRISMMMAGLLSSLLEVIQIKVKVRINDLWPMHFSFGCNEKTKIVVDAAMHSSMKGVTASIVRFTVEKKELTFFSSEEII